jgi:hypothetical protein
MQLKSFLTINKTAKPDDYGTIEELKNVVSKLQEDITQQRIITQAVTEENIKIKNAIQTIAKTIVGNYPISAHALLLAVEAGHSMVIHWALCLFVRYNFHIRCSDKSYEYSNG